MKSLIGTITALFIAGLSWACPIALIPVEQSCNNYLFYLQETPVGNVIWDFGDGTQTTGTIEIFHEFPEDGVYIVEATFSGPGCPETITLNATVIVNCGSVNDCPTEIWSGPAATCGTMNFEISSFVEGESVIWNPGDGSDPVEGGHFYAHAYANPGTYTVCAVYTTPLCPEGVELCTIIIVEECTTSLCPTAIVASAMDCDTYLFEIEGLDNANVTWSFGDGSVSSGGIVAEHSWTNNGIFIVTASVEAPLCPIVPPTNIITLVYTVSVNCNPPSNCPTEIWAFETATCGTLDFELDLFAPDASVIWYPGDETSPVQGVPYFQHAYTNSGVYNVCAVYTSSGCPQGVELCSFVVVNACNTECSEAGLVIDSYVQEGGPTSIAYTLFDAVTNEVITGGFGEYSPENPFLDVAVCIPDGCYYLLIESTDTLTIGSGLSMQLLLDGVDVLESAEQIPQKNYMILYYFGINSVCEGQPSCEAGFEVLYSETPGHVEFINNSSFSGNAVFTWDYGNGATETIENGSSVYVEDGIYIACLTVATANCENTYCDFVIIENTETPCAYNEVTFIVDATYFEPVSELLQLVVSFGQEPIHVMDFETDNLINNTLSVCIPDGCYDVSINSALPVQALSIVCSFEGDNIQQLGNLQLLIGETNSTAAIGVNMDCAIGIEEEHTQTINAYPNPACDNIQFASVKNIESIEVFDLTGKRILAVKPNQLQTQLNTADWSDGLYVAQITVDGKKEQVPFEIVK